MISVIGAVNVDITAQPATKYIPYDSNPGFVRFTVGGVGRNIACNLSSLSCDVLFFTALGNDTLARFAIEDCTQHGVDISKARKNDAGSSYYVCVTNENGELQSGVADMDLVRSLTTDYIRSNLDFLNTSEAVVFDTNLEEETIEYLLRNVKVPLFADTVSGKKAVKLKRIHERNILLPIFALKTNTVEAEAMTGIRIENEKDAVSAAKKIHGMGIRNVYLTMGSKGSCFYDGEKAVFAKAPVVEVVNATGAGDSFLAALICAYLHGFNEEEMLSMGIAASEITLRSAESVSPEMSYENLLKKAGIDNE